MKKTTTFIKASKIISIILVAATMATIFCGCSVIPQKICNHNYYLSDYTEATTSTTGFKKFTCSGCGSSYQEVIPIKTANTPMEVPQNTTDIPEETTPDLTRKRSVNLFDLPVYSCDEGYVDSLCYRAEETDVDGWKHKDCYIICGSEFARWYRYELNGKYSTVSGTIFDYASSGGSGWLEFYDGEDFLAATPKVDSETTSVEFEIDITGVEYLTVHFRATEPGTWMIADDILLTK